MNLPGRQPCSPSCSAAPSRGHALTPCSELPQPQPACRPALTTLGCGRACASAAAPALLQPLREGPHLGPTPQDTAPQVGARRPGRMRERRRAQPQRDRRGLRPGCAGWRWAQLRAGARGLEQASSGCQTFPFPLLLPPSEWHHPTDWPLVTVWTVSTEGLARQLRALVQIH